MLFLDKNIHSCTSFMFKTISGTGQLPMTPLPPFPCRKLPLSATASRIIAPRYNYPQTNAPRNNWPLTIDITPKQFSSGKLPFLCNWPQIIFLIPLFLLPPKTMVIRIIIMSFIDNWSSIRWRRGEYEKRNVTQSIKIGNTWENRENKVMETRVTTEERQEITNGTTKKKKNNV